MSEQPIACENCSSTSEFFRDSGGFLVCVDCGQQQPDYREEYRDEFDVAFENTGFHVIPEGGLLQNAARGRTTVSAVTEGGSRKRTGSSDDDDYDDLDEDNFDPNWKRKAPSENDFLRALQIILMRCTKDLVIKLGFPSTLEEECRQMWLWTMRIFVETDYPAQTYFCNLKSRQHKIGVRRVFRPPYSPPDLASLDEDDNVPLDVKKVAHVLGTDRLHYVKAVAPFYNCSGARRRGPALEVVKLREPISAPQTVTTTATKIGLEDVGVISSGSGDKNAACADLAAPSLNSKPHSCRSEGEETQTLAVVDTPPTPQTVTENSLGAYHVSAFTSLRPKRSVKERRRDACLAADIQPPKEMDACLSTRVSAPPYRIPRYMRANPNNRYMKYADDTKEPTALGFPQENLKLMVRERLLSQGPRRSPYSCGGSVSSRPKSVMHTSSSVEMALVADPRWQVDQIYEHDFLAQYCALSETETVSASASVPIQSQVSITTDGASGYPRGDKDSYSKAAQRDPLLQAGFRFWAARGVWFSQKADAESQLDMCTIESPTDEEHTGEKFSDAVVTDKCEENQRPLTQSALHRAYFQRRTVRHELSAPAVIERILRRWASHHHLRTRNSSLKQSQSDDLQSLLLPTTQDAAKALLQLCDSLGDHKVSDAGASTPTSQTLVLGRKEKPVLPPSFMLSYIDTLNQTILRATTMVGEDNTVHSLLTELEAPDGQGRKNDSLVPLKRLDPFYHQDDWGNARVISRSQRLIEWETLLKRGYIRLHNTTRASRRQSNLGYSSRCKETKRKKAKKAQVDHEVLSKTFPTPVLASVPQSLLTIPPVSMPGVPFLSDDRLLGLYFHLCSVANDVLQEKFFPVLRHHFKTANNVNRSHYRSALIRETFERLAHPSLVKTRLFHSQELEPPCIDHVLILAILWIGLLNTRHGKLIVIT